MCGHVPEARGKMKKCNGPDMESRKGWFTLFPVEPSFSVKFFFLYLLRGVELGQPEKRNDAVPRFSRASMTHEIPFKVNGGISLPKLLILYLH